MAWVTPPTYTVSQVLTAALMNNISGDFNYFKGSANAIVGTSQTTTSTTYVDLTTVGPTVTVTTDVQALVIWRCWGSNDTGSDGAAMAFAVSGASTLAASDSNALVVASTVAVSGASGYLQVGLTAGSNTFTAKYRATSGGTATFLNRSISVVPL